MKLAIIGSHLVDTHWEESLWSRAVRRSGKQTVYNFGNVCYNEKRQCAAFFDETAQMKLEARI